MAEDNSLHAARRIRVTAIVNVIEARHLAGKDSNGLSDPFVRVTVAGRRQTTEIRRNSINATWDQTFTFQDMDLSVEEFQAELVVLQVFDANVIFANELIGQFSFGLAKVRNQPPPHRHQVYRRWLMLTDPKNPLEEQGYLQVSVTVLGPGDVPPAHSRQEDYAGLVATPHQQTGDAERVLRNPDVRRRGYNFSIKVFRGEDLAVTDPWNNASDPFVVVRFNGLMARTPHQPRTTSPSWNHLLVLPIFTPCFSNTIEIQLFDYVRGQPDRLLATRRLAFTSLLGQSFPPSWYNFYGRMDEERDSSGWVCDVIRSFKSDRDATNYMGRILLSFNTELTDKPVHIDRPCPPIKGPKSQPFILSVDVYEIAELDLSFGRKVMIELQFGPHKRQSDWCTVGTVQPLPQKRHSARRSNNDSLEDGHSEEDDEYVLEPHVNGVLLSCSGDDSHEEFSHTASNPAARQATRRAMTSNPAQFRSIEVPLPTRGSEPTVQECAQFYDVILNVYVKGIFGSPQRVGFLRFKAIDIMGTSSTPEWFPVRGVTNKAGASETPAQLLVSVRFGQKLGALKRLPMQPPARERFQLCAHVYQARNLRATDDQGLANPYVTISLAGKTARNNNNPIDPRLERTSVVASTLDPVWYETMVVDEVRLPSQLSLAPDIDICVQSKVEGARDEIIGRVKFPAALCSLEFWPATKRPRWLRLARSELTALRANRSLQQPVSLLQTDGKIGVESEFEAESQAGDILIKLELVPIREIRAFPLWAHRWPRVVPCEVHLGTVGLRRLEEYGLFGSIDRPFCEVMVQSIPNMLAPSAIATNVVEGQPIISGTTQPNSSAVSGGVASHLNESVHSRQGAGPRMSTPGGPGALHDIGLDNEDGLESGIGPGDGCTARSVARELSSAWTNRREEDKSILTKLFAADDPQFSKSSPAGKLAHGPTNGSGNNATTTVVESGNDENVGAAANRVPDGSRSVESGRGKTESRDLETGPESADTEGLTEAEQSAAVLIRKERKRRTFFDTVTLIVNMPIDPFYAQSMTIKVLDERFAKAEVIATATISLRDFAEQMLYTHAMKLDAKVVEDAFEIPRINVSGRARKDFSRWVRRSPNACDEEYYHTPRQSEEEADAEATLQFHDLQKQADAERKRYLAQGIPAEEGSSREVGMLPNVSIDVSAGSLLDRERNEVDDPYDTAFQNPAEGHYNLPSYILEDADDMNVEYEDSLKQIVTSRGIQLEEEAAEAYTGGLLWPQEDGQTREAGMQTHLLETSQSLQPAPFQSIQLFRGSQMAGLDGRKGAGFFKAAIVIRPKVPEFVHLLVAQDAWPASDHSKSNRRGELVSSSNAERGDLFLFEEDLDKLFVVVRPVKYSPDKGLEYREILGLEDNAPCFLPRKILAPLPAPFAASKPSDFSRTSSSFAESNGLHSYSSPRHHEEEKEEGKADVVSKNEQGSQAGAYLSIARSMNSPQDVKVRVYIVACANLPSQAYFSSSSDPYIVVQLNVPQYLKDTYAGAVYYNGRIEYKADTLDPYFGAWVELDARFPDVTELEIQVWNANYLSDDLIGKTVIDLEDRWFNPAWQQLKYKRKLLKEFRPLFAPSSKLVQGVCECWVEMYSPGEAASTAVVDIREPKVEPWQLRFVVWETRQVPLMEGHNYANLFVSGELTYTDIQGRTRSKEYTTDTHTGLKDGKGIFNFRMLYPFEAPSKFIRLKIKVWARYGLSYTALGEANMDLDSLMREAVRTQSDVIDRPRTWVALTHSNWPGDRRGDMDVQMSLVREKYSLQHPVGNARDAPNENPFLPEPPRESFFAQDKLVTQNKFNEALALVRVHPKDKEIFDRLFVLFDRAGDGVICSREVMVGCSILVKAAPRKKLQFALEIFDETGEGKISRQDLTQTLRWLSKTSAFFGDKQPTAEAMGSLVERVFNKISEEDPEDTSYAIYVDPMLDHPTLTDFTDQVEDSTRLQNEPID
ncbi:Synaptotagmin-1 [Hondaea fermentalgiana]|uniref:Synaptotagmin-1 n=1 Tax=Hondaea fermentalgiana TaxID=2315210 RepID=A0A2R5H1A5_9STRA|nr:Synaptotagmin-1 [Hondaea fermentalgiana]|eukprot:GBG34114.1 Synaptotagmin-1 [Hondaea fermentalgiana]